MHVVTQRSPTNSLKSCLGLDAFYAVPKANLYYVYYYYFINQETSQSLISHSWTRDPDSSSAESSQSLVPHSLECELGSTDQNPQIGDLVVVYLRCTGRGRKRRQVTRTGIVKEIDSRDPQRVKTDNCSRKFRKVLEICQRRSTSMISNDTESQSEYSISQYY